VGTGTDAGGDIGSSGVQIFPSHIGVPLSRPSVGDGDELRFEDQGTMGATAVRLRVHDVSVRWRLFAGNDWETQASASSAQEGGDNSSVAKGAQPDEDRAAPEVALPASGHSSRDERKAKLMAGLLGECTPGGGAAKWGNERDEREPEAAGTGKGASVKRRGSAGRGRGRSSRTESTTLDVRFQHMQFRLDCSDDQASVRDLRTCLLMKVQELFVCDTLQSRRPRKALSRWNTPTLPKWVPQRSMVELCLTSKAAALGLPGELSNDYELKLRLLPLHLSFSQRTIDFIRSFLPAAAAAAARSTSHATKAPPRAGRATPPPFFELCDIGPVQVKMDYTPRLINPKNLQAGAYLELLNLCPLDGVELTLKPIDFKGVSGAGALMSAVMQAWVHNITTSQLHHVLAGAAPFRPFWNIGKGMAALVLLPMRQYRREHQVLRGLRRGAGTFLGVVTLELLHTPQRLLQCISSTLDGIITPKDEAAGTVMAESYQHHQQQPQGVLQSLDQAYDCLAKEVKAAAHTVLAIQYVDFQRKGGVLRHVVRALPIAVLRPVVGATAALSCILLGFRNHISPAMRLEEEDMWSAT
ncbi:unnamed protein product, partial [Chrysoparadoxa australica]